MNEELTLAPAAGSGIGKKIADMLLAKQAFMDDLVAVFRDGLKATTPVFRKGNSEPIEMPDHKTRLATATSILAHMEGEPIKRIIHQRIGGSAAPRETLEELAARSPALRRRLAEILRRTENAKPVGPNA